MCVAFQPPPRGNAHRQLCAVHERIHLQRADEHNENTAQGGIIITHVEHNVSAPCIRLGRIQLGC